MVIMQKSSHKFLQMRCTQHIFSSPELNAELFWSPVVRPSNFQNIILLTAYYDHIDNH